MLLPNFTANFSALPKDVYGGDDTPYIAFLLFRLAARVNIVSPGFFDTGMGAAPDVLDVAFDMAVLGRQGTPRELKGVSSPLFGLHRRERD